MAERLGARENSSFMAICTTPDICKTPVGPNIIPIPYTVIADLGQSENCVPNARFNGDPCKVLDQSTVPRCTGDEPGFIGGVRSGTVAGEVKPVSACSNVRAGGRSIVREFDPCTLNSGNCPGIYVTVSAPGSTIEAAGKPDPRANSPVEPTPAEKEGFLKRWLHQTKSDLGLAAEHPGEAAAGAVKGTINTLPELGDVMAQGSALQHAAEMEERAALMRMFGPSRAADQMQAGAEALRQSADQITFPKLDMSHPAAPAGDRLFTLAQFVLGAAGLLKSGARAGIRTLAKSGGSAVAGKADDVARLGSTASREMKAADAAADATKADQALAGKGGQLPRKKGAAAPDVDKPPKGDGVRIRRTAHEGAAFGEQKAHAKMKEMGYERIDKGGEYKPGRNGIDGVYRNPNPPPDYVIMEAKYNTAKLGDTVDGKQMSDSWVNGETTGFDRLREAVGPRTADKIRESIDAGRVQKLLLQVDESGKVSIKALDILGNIIKP